MPAAHRQFAVSCLSFCQWACAARCATAAGGRQTDSCRGWRSALMAPRSPWARAVEHTSGESEGGWGGCAWNSKKSGWTAKAPWRCSPGRNGNWSRRHPSRRKAEQEAPGRRAAPRVWVTSASLLVSACRCCSVCCCCCVSVCGVRWPSAGGDRLQKGLRTRGWLCVCVSVENTNTRYKFCQVLFECLVTAEWESVVRWMFCSGTSQRVCECACVISFRSWLVS